MAEKISDMTPAPLPLEGDELIEISKPNVSGYDTYSTSLDSIPIPLANVEGAGDLAALDTVDNTNWLGAPLAVENGGTNAVDAPNARINLGLGTMATQNAISVAINGGTAQLGLAQIYGTTNNVASDLATARSNAVLEVRPLLSNSTMRITFGAIDNDDSYVQVVNNAGTTPWNLNLNPYGGAVLVNGGAVYRAGGTDVPVADGGTGASDAPTARTNLGLGTASTAPLTNSQSSVTAGQVLKVGDYGLGLMMPQFQADLNTFTTPGSVAVVGSAITNYPGGFGSSAAVIEVEAGSTNTTAGPHATNARIIQRATKYSVSAVAPFVAFRGYDGTAWTAWYYDYGTAATAADARTNLGLGTAATATLTTSTTDATTGRVLKVADFNIGNVIAIETTIDLNTVVGFGWRYLSSSGIANAPLANASAGLLFVNPVTFSGITRVFQTFYAYSAGNYSRQFSRVRVDATTWTPWAELQSLIGRAPYLTPDYNTFTSPGFYALSGTGATNAPAAAGFLMNVITGTNVTTNDLILQVATRITSPFNTYTRVFDGTAWSAWTSGLTSADLTASSISTTANKVVKVGDYGLGVGPSVETSVDYNTKTVPGVYLIGATLATNAPNTTFAHTLCVFSGSATVTNDRLIQVAYALTTPPNIYIRYYNGSTWTAWVRQYGLGATQAAARTDLGLGTSATMDVTTAVSSTTPGQVLKVGDYGLGVGPPSTDPSDWNTLTTPGFHLISATAGTANSPIAGQVATYAALVIASTAGLAQVAFGISATTGNVFVRSFTASGSVWTTWRRIYTDSHNDKVTLASSPPASATAAGVAGSVAYDSTYFYICTATNTWRRVAHATW